MWGEKVMYPKITREDVASKTTWKFLEVITEIKRARVNCCWYDLTVFIELFVAYLRIAVEVN